METAMAGPVTACAKVPISTRMATPSCCPKVFKIVPISRDANKPCAIAPKASMPYRFAEKTISFFARKAAKPF